MIAEALVVVSRFICERQDVPRGLATDTADAVTVAQIGWRDSAASICQMTAIDKYNEEL